MILPTEPVNLIPHPFNNLVRPGDADALPKRHNPTEKLRVDIDRTFSFCLLLSQNPSAIVIGASISYLGAKIHTLTEMWVIMTTGLAGGLTKPYKGIRPAALTRSESPPTASLFTGSR